MPDSATVDVVLELVTVTDWLVASLLPGTERPYRPELSADKKSELRQLRAMELRHDAHSGMLVPLGESPAIADFDVMDLLVEILEMAARWSGLPAPRSSWENPRPHLEAIVGRRHTRSTVALVDACEDLIERAHKVLGLFGDGQLLGAICPWCRGVTARHPEGGQRTWRVRVKLPAGKRSLVGVHVDSREIRWFVVCESGTCNPPVGDVGTWWRDGSPAWDLRNEDTFLAKRLEKAAS